MSMLLLHIIIATASLIFAGYMYFSPSARKIQVSYGLVGATIASGTWLIVSNPSHLMKSCVYGLIYLGVVFFCIARAQQKLGSTTE